jgi:hypothetical protein
MVNAQPDGIWNWRAFEDYKGIRSVHNEAARHFERERKSLCYFKHVVERAEKSWVLSAQLPSRSTHILNAANAQRRI